MRRRSVIIPVLIGVAVLGALFLGRNMLGGSMPFAGQNLGQPRGISTTPSPKLNRPGLQIRQQIGFDSKKADNISRQLGSVDGIRQINTVVNGSTALISYSPTGKGTNLNTTKNMIANKVKQMDNTITDVIVSDSADFSSKVKRLVDNIKNNMPANNLNDEFNRLIQNIKSGGR